MMMNVTCVLPVSYVATWELNSRPRLEGGSGVTAPNLSA